MSDRLAGYWLGEPMLRFDYENRKAVSDNAYEGLRSLGPYDRFNRKTGGAPCRAVIVGRVDKPDEISRAKKALETKRLGKLHDVFNIKVVQTVTVAPSKPKGEVAAYSRAVDEWLTGSPYKPEVDIAIVLHEEEDFYRRYAEGRSPYFATKALLLPAGIPTQSITYRNLDNRRGDEFEKYFVPNILTACYAKVGGIPWVISDDSIESRPDVTLGIGMTHIGSGAETVRYVGICTIFKENGAFSLWSLTSPQTKWDSYEEQLEASIVKSVIDFEAREGKKVRKIACHVSGKRPGKRELRPIERALAQLADKQIQADLVHITSDAILWLFDGRDNSHRPESGFVAQLALDGSTNILHTEGRDTKTRGFPVRPLKIGLYSDIPASGSKPILQHLYDLRWMSWRGVRAASKPVTVDYPQRMARLLAELHAHGGVEALQILPNNHGSAWFL